MKKHLLEISGRLFESIKDDAGRVKFPVVIISQGMGNLVDKNYYTSQAIQSGASVYEGKKCYFDHPTRDQSEQQPGRSVRETAGHYENCRAETDKDGLMVLKADFIPEMQNQEVIGKILHAVEYKKKYPDKDYIGISINGDGEGKSVSFEEFLKEAKPLSIEMEKINQIKGEEVNIITKLTDAVSADLVTEPGAKGRVLIEQAKIIKKRRSKMFIQAFKKLFLGLETNDKTLTEAAVNSMLQSESDDEEAKKKEAAAKEAAAEEMESKEAEGMAKAMLACKKEMKKEDGESEEKYEARCMKQAKKNMASEKKESEKKEEGDKSEAAKEAAKKSEGDDDKDHKDADQDKALFKKLMKDNEELKKENESMKKEMESVKKESKKEAEESAKLKIAAVSKKREEMIDRVLAESGMRREITKIIRPVLEKCKTEDEIKETAKQLIESHSKVIESEFYAHASRGFTEFDATGDKSASTDHLFS